ncbi:hemagglutinin/amebocyte aggregation factor [Salpingoeca rosetta]|uniref:Hemagglutinin/amebocyte aggregation factor n=1 Tax=Salpingoeca rosetta (strain ATCC 50818 / BSB-021) TaxID=946362 RepID=F2UIW4_SALR5|nr:hemagglutinin/amebocyte aggregation factor [Salpingoeca rosetta]EGD77163.1 hemagglutinin/amebocyte aggregation factor [Salpingoeca rosetta]|eukprot:XP_004991002.1 hemagglutinin/amebocyte aggregation factor [Salpingoeca rosetta]
MTMAGAIRRHRFQRHRAAVLFTLVSVLGLLHNTPSASAWLNSLDGALTFSCSAGQGISTMKSYHTNDKEDRQWDFGCSPVSTGDAGSGTWSGYVNSYDGDIDYTCGSNQYITGLSSEHSNSNEDRIWKVKCASVNNAKLIACRTHAGYINDYDDSMNYESGDRILVGIFATHDNSKEDRRFKPKTCQVECNRDTGYRLKDGRECERDTCTYASCNTGYKLSLFGSESRTCGWSGLDPGWSGTAKQCEDIDECATGQHNCPDGAICSNTDGSFTCNCEYGTLSGGECYVAPPSSSMSVYLTSLYFTLSGGWTSEFPKYQISVARWAYDLSSYENVAGYPKTVSGSISSHTASGLDAGTRYHVTVTPLHTNGDELTHFTKTVYYSGSTDAQTPCGCGGSSGAPTDFKVKQFKGHILFEWADQSQCESAFTFTRNGVGLAARFDVTEQQACGAVQKPLSISDDLTIQSPGGYAEVDSSINYKLPDGSFYLRLSTAVEEGEMRLKYPRELQRDGGHFASTSTTTTAAPQGVPDDENRYYPGTSSPVASVTECKDLCDIRSSWCIAFVVQTKGDDTLVCHQLRVVETAALKSGEKKAVSYERVTVSGTGVSGSYIFDGTQDDCEQACTDSGSCVLTMVDSGVCGIINSAVTTGTPASSIHASLDPDFSRRIPGPEPGRTQTYCIAATNPTWYTEGGYSSGQTCTSYTIQWESQLEGQITIDSKEIHLPVEHVEIEYEIGPIRGRRVTNEDGKFFIHILTDQLQGNRHRITLRFSKTTGNIKHTFTCGGIACTETTLIMEHLRFDHQVNVKDTTSLPFSGIVSIGGTEHEGLPDGCPLKDVEVCLYDRHQANTLINCDVTDSKGRYLVRAVLGTSVTVSLAYGNSSHTFERVTYDQDAANAPSGILQTINALNSLERTPYYDVTDGKFWENINFKDTTSDTATVDIAGGLCNLNLGDAVMEFRYDACPTWVKSRTISDRLSKWTLPAQIITVRFKEITRNYEVRGEITRYFSAKLGNSRSLYLDLRNPQEDDEDKKTVRFEYHPPPQLSVEFDKEEKHNCNSTEGDRPLHVIKQNVELKATVKVIEDYGEGVGTCDAVPGQIEVENQLGESPATVDALNATTSLTDKQLNKLKLCYDTCLMDVKMDEELKNGETVYSNTRIELNIMTGEPETNPQAVNPENPYSKLFRVTMHNLPQDPVSVYEKVVVVGDKVISKYFSVPFPRYQPLTVIQDPPGGLSTVTYSKAYTNFLVDSHTHEEYHGFYFTTGLAPVKVETGVQQCVGLGAAVCTKVADTESTPFKLTVDQTHTFGNMDPDDNYGTERVWSFEIELTTSDDVMTAGERSDMFLVPALNVVWLETEEVSFDVEQCQAAKETKVKWSLEGQDNSELITWLSAFEIENKELPDLRKLLALAEQPPGDDDDDDETEADRLEKVAELKRAIKAWEDNLDRNKEVRDKAAAGTLDPVQDLWSKTSAEHDCAPPLSMIENPKKASKLLSEASKVNRCDGFGAAHIKDDAGKGISLAPHDLIDGATDLDDKEASDQDKQDLRSIKTIKFSGGGSTYTFGFDLEQTKSAVGGSSRTHEVTAGVDVEFGFKVFGVGMSFELSTGYNYEGTTAEEHEAGVTTGTHIEFTLGDPDPLDVFDVQVFLHPDYGTLVFHTTSGQSSCPHEPNTVQLEKPSVSVLKRPEAPVLPGEPAVFELLLKNDGPMTSDFNLFYLSWLNQDGLEVVANGQALETALIFEGFPGNSAKYITITVNQGPNKFKYDPVAIGWRSLCEADRHPDNGYITDEVTSVEYVYLEAEFLQPCSPVKLVGEIGESGAFTLNQETMEQDYKPGQIRVVAFNPDHAERTWLEDDRLEKVVIEFKPVNSYIWLLARDENGDALDIRKRENEYGYITSWWDASTLLEGDYHLRIRAQCQASINEMPDGIDEKLSSVALGVVDRDPPVVFGFPEPADGEFFPGDEISFQFNEDVECRQPFIFQVSLTVEDYDRDFNNNNMVIVCEGRKISMSLRRGFRYDEVNGLSATVVIENVKDLNGNQMEFPPEHKFKFAELTLEDASASVSGLELDIPFQAVYLDTASVIYTNFTRDLAREISGLVGVPAYRVEIVLVEPVDENDYTQGTSVTLKFAPASTQPPANQRRRRATEDLNLSATQLASLLQEKLQNTTLVETLPVLSSTKADAQVSVEVEPSSEDVTQAAAAAAASSSLSSSSTSSSDSFKIDTSLALNITIVAQLLVVLIVLARMHLYGVKSRTTEVDGFRGSEASCGSTDKAKTKTTTNTWYKPWSKSGKVEPFTPEPAESAV